MLEEILKKYPQHEDSLIEILLEYQNKKTKRFITEEEIAQISNYLGVTESKVCSVVSFYTFFSTEPRGKHIIQICKDVPCYVNGSGNVLKTLEQLLNIRIGETTKDEKFTLEYTSCLGNCDGAPAMRIDGKTFTNLNPNKVKAIISEYRGVN